MQMWVLWAIYMVFPLVPYLRGNETRIAFESHLAGAAFALAYKQFDLRLVAARVRSIPQAQAQGILTSARAQPLASSEHLVDFVKRRRQLEGRTRLGTPRGATRRPVG